MAAILEPESESTVSSTSNNQAAAVRLRENFSACRLQFKWMGTSKSLSSEQKSQAADSFGADAESINAGKRLIDVKHEAWKSLTSIKSQATKYWKENSLPYPETGLRLIRQDKVEEFNSTFEDFRTELTAGVHLFDQRFVEIKEAARDRLGSLFDLTDYPSTLEDEFGIEWSFPAVNPPDYLKRLNPEVYAEQTRRVAQRFDEAVQLAEAAFFEELDKLVSHLAERLAGDDDGRPKIFRDSAVTNMGDFFTRFRSLNIRSNDQLDELVERCEGLLNNVQPAALRSDDGLRRSLSTNLAAVRSSLDQLIVDSPRRKILRTNRSIDQSGGQ